MPTFEAIVTLPKEQGSHKMTTVAATTEGAIDQFKRVYGATEVTNCYEVKGNSSSGGSGSTMDTETAVGAVAVGAGLIALIMFLPWILMAAGGAAGTWIGQKMTGYSIEEFNNTTNHSEKEMKRAGVILAMALLLGGIGFTTGHNFVNNDGSVDNVEEVRN